MTQESYSWGVDHVAQGHTNTCWAACTAMLVNTRDGTSLDDDDVCAEVGVDPDASDAAATDSEWTSDYLPQFRLSHVAGQSMIPEGWIELLQQSPTIVGVTGHVVVASGYESDGTEDGTFIWINDPAESSPEWWSFQEIDERFAVRAGRDIHMIQY